MRSVYVTLCLLCSFGLSICASAQSPSLAATLAGFVAGVQDPEDLLQLSGTDWIVVSSMQLPDGSPGHLDIIKASAVGSRKAIYPSVETGLRTDALRFPGCTPPDPKLFFPHGINFVRLADGKFEVYAINHGGRESVEIFRLAVSAASVQAEWIGCVLLPPHSYGNGIAPLPAGGFVLSNMYDPTDLSFLKKFDAGAPTGNVLAWKPPHGWSQAIPQKLSGPNGLEVSADGHWLYVSEWSAQRLWKISMDGTQKSQHIRLAFLPDNLRWTPQGTLLLAGQNAKPSQVMGCDARHIACPEKFTVAEIDPVTLNTSILVRGGGCGFGGATGAAMVDGQLWVGSFRGNRIAKYSFRKK